MTYIGEFFHEVSHIIVALALLGQFGQVEVVCAIQIPHCLLQLVETNILGDNHGIGVSSDVDGGGEGGEQGEEGNFREHFQEFDSSVLFLIIEFAGKLFFNGYGGSKFHFNLFQNVG